MADTLDVALSDTSTDAFNRREPIVGALGTSSVALSYSFTTGGDVWARRGWLSHLASMCPQIRISRDHVFGLSGLTSVDMMATLPAILAASPRMSSILIQLSSNDVVSMSPATSYANYVAMLQMCIRAGVIPILVVAHAAGGYSSEVEPIPTYRKRFLALCEMSRFINRDVNGARVVDLSEATKDPAVSGFFCVPAYDDDGTHLNPYGCVIAAMQIKKVIDALFPVPARRRVLTDQDQWSTDNPYGCLNLNPTMLGTGGVATSVGGVVADSYTANNGMTGVTVVGSKVTKPDGRIAQRFALSGTATAGFLSFAVSVPTLARQAIANGDNLELCVDAEISGTMAGCGILASRITMVGGSAKTNRHFEQNSDEVPVARKLFLRPPPLAISGAVSDASGAWAVYYPKNGVACSGLIIDIMEVSLRKLRTINGLNWG